MHVNHACPFSYKCEQLSKLYLIPFENYNQNILLRHN